MKIQEDLVWDKNTGELIGYVDLGDAELTYTTMKNAGTIASHILVFLICGIVNPIKFSLANFATSNALSTQLFPHFWDAVAILEDRCGLKVMAVTSDGASANRSMYKMLCKMNNVEHINTDVDVGYRVLNHFAEKEEDRYIYLLGDAPHSQKTARNCLYHSGFDDYCSRLMCKDGYFLLWNHIRQLFKEDLECGLHLVPKITSEHINLSPFSVMNVRLAAQVLSSSVSVALTTYGPAEARETAKYCYMFDKYFDCMNSRNTTEAHRKQKPDLARNESEDDNRFDWLGNTFLAYLQNWKKSIEATPNITASQKAKMFISWQT